MAKAQKKNNSNSSNHSSESNDSSSGAKKKRSRKSSPRESPSQRSSVYRGVTRHRWTGRFEAHLWDKNCWNESQNKKGRQVYLGAYDDEAAAAHAYDLAALKYWGHDTILNFPLLTYEEETKEMEKQSKEEYIGSLRRKSSGFSRGVSKYRGVAKHHHNGRWEARIGRVFGNKYLYLGTFATQEEAAVAYDMAAIEHRGLNAVTNFDLSRYIKWLPPNPNAQDPNHNVHQITHSGTPQDLELIFQQHNQSTTEGEGDPAAASSTLDLLLRSPKFQDMLDRTSPVADGTGSGSPPPLTSPESDGRPSRCSFPEDIQTYFECAEDGHDAIFGDLTSFTSSIFQYELDTVGVQQ